MTGRKAAAAGEEIGTSSPVADFPVAEAFLELVRNCASDFPLPGSGRTAQRFESLRACAEIDLSLARLTEGHFDAIAILDEAGMSGRHPTATYGVWAARSPAHRTSVLPVSRGWKISGSKQFCSGVGVIDRALVTAEAPDGYRLFDVELSPRAISVEPGSWPAVGMAASASETVTFSGVLLSEVDEVGSPDFYTTRPGFWFGAAGVAACWYGGASGLVSHLIRTLDGEPGEHVLADLGRSVSRICAMRAVIADAAASIDADPTDKDGRARLNALEAREIVHDLGLEVLTSTASAGGARSLCHDAGQARRAADLYVYLAQHRGGRDAAELGRISLERSPGVVRR
jgi:alkylation response protein AidB-like acyl-CoA dehydrogenase